MNSRERFRVMFSGEPASRTWLEPEGMWAKTNTRWQKEGMTDEDLTNMKFDGITGCQVCDMTPPFEEKLIKDEGDKHVIISASGQTVRSWKDPGSHDPGYQVLDSPVKDMQSWEALKWRLDPEHPDHLGDDWQERVKNLQAGGKPIRLDAGHSLSIFGYSRELMGDDVYLNFYDQPELMHTVMDFLADRFVRLIDRVSEHLQLGIIHIWEDMSYKGAPLISPEMFREFMLQPTRRICEAADRNGASAKWVDSDGDITKLIPLWLEAGVNVISPCEVAAGMDVNKVRDEFGNDFFISGGYDKRALFKGRKEIDAEFERLRPVCEQGKFFLSVDHSIPPEVSLENYKYYMARKRKFA